MIFFLTAILLTRQSCAACTDYKTSADCTKTASENCLWDGCQCYLQPDKCLWTDHQANKEDCEVDMGCAYIGTACKAHTQCSDFKTEGAATPSPHGCLGDTTCKWDETGSGSCKAKTCADYNTEPTCASSPGLSCAWNSESVTCVAATGCSQYSALGRTGTFAASWRARCGSQPQFKCFWNSKEAVADQTCDTYTDCTSYKTAGDCWGNAKGGRCAWTGATPSCKAVDTCDDYTAGGTDETYGAVVKGLCSSYAEKHCFWNPGSSSNAETCAAATDCPGFNKDLTACDNDQEFGCIKKEGKCEKATKCEDIFANYFLSCEAKGRSLHCASKQTCIANVWISSCAEAKGCGDYSSEIGCTAGGCAWNDQTGVCSSTPPPADSAFGVAASLLALIVTLFVAAL